MVTARRAYLCEEVLGALVGSLLGVVEILCERQVQANEGLCSTRKGLHDDVSEKTSLVARVARLSNTGGSRYRTTIDLSGIP